MGEAASGGGGGFFVGSIWGKLLLDKTGWNQAIESVKKDFGYVLKNAGKIGQEFDETGRKLQGFGKQVMLAGAAITGTLGASVKAYSDFDSAMTESTAIMTDLSDAMRNDMADAAKEVSKVTTFSASDAAKAYYYLASAGLSAEESIKALPAVSKFAQAGMFNLETATSLLADAQSALGLKIDNDAVANMKNMVRVSDVLVKANILANASTQEFSESLTTRAGAALRMVNKDVEEGVAVLATFADQGIKGAEAGTRLDIVLRDLQTKAIQNSDVFEKFGVQVFDADGKMRNIADIMENLETLFDGMSDKQKRAALMTMEFSDRSVSSILALVGTSNAIREYEGELRKSGDTTEKIAKNQLKSLNAQWKLTKNQLNLAALEIGKNLGPLLVSMAQHIRDLAERVTDWTKKHPHLTKALTLTAAAVGSFLLVGGSAIFMLGTFARSIGAVIKALPLLKTGMAAIKSQVAAMKKPLSSTGGILGKIGAVGAAAFIGWEAGRLIGELTGLDGVLQGVFDKTFRLLGIIKETNVEWGEGHTGKEALRQEALAKAVEVSGGKVDNSVQAWRILRDEYKKTGTTGSGALDEVLKRQLASIKPAENHTKVIKKQKSAFGELVDGMANAKGKAESLAETLGITTSTETQDRIKKLNEALLVYRGQLTADQIAKIRAEIDELSRSTKLSLIPAAEDVEKFTSQTLGNLEAMALSVCREIGKTGDYTVDQMEADLGKITGKWKEEIPKASEKATAETKSHFDGLYNDIARGFGDTASGLLGEICKGLNFADMEFFKHGINFKKYFEEAFEGIKQAFFRQIGEMTSAAILDKFKGLFKSVGKSGQDAMSGIANAATGANKVAQGIGQAAGSAASGFLSAAGSIASIVTAVASVADLLKGPQKQTDVTYWLKFIRESTLETRDWLFINAQEKLNFFAEKLEDIKVKAGDMVYSRLDAVCLKLDWIGGTVLGQINEGIGYLGRVGDKVLAKIKGAATGAVITSPQFLAVAESGPEVVWPLDRLHELAPVAKSQPANVNISIDGSDLQVPMGSEMRQLIIKLVPKMSKDGILKIHPAAVTKF